jgi:DNA-binding beta-propeller fold protein YncE
MTNDEGMTKPECLKPKVFMADRAIPDVGRTKFPLRASSFVMALLLIPAVLAASPVGAPNPARTPAWPPPPAEPYVIYRSSIAGPADVGIKQPALSRFATWITGNSRGPSRLEKPFGIALDEAGDLLITDTGANVVCCLDHAGKKWLQWEQAGKTRFASPVAVARHRDTVFVADSMLGKVLAMDLKGKLLFEITGKLQRPSGLAIHGDRLYVADAQKHQVVACNVNGEVLSKFGSRGTSPGQFNFPTHIAVDNEGRLFVTDSMNCRIQVFSAAGEFQRVIGSPGDGPGAFSRPKGVAVDRYGHIYVVDALFENVQIFDDQGRLLLHWGEAGGAPGQFWLPNGIAISSNNEIYVADSYNHRVQVFQYTGKK